MSIGIEYRKTTIWQKIGAYIIISCFYIGGFFLYTQGIYIFAGIIIFIITLYLLLSIYSFRSIKKDNDIIERLKRGGSYKVGKINKIKDIIGNKGDPIGYSYVCGIAGENNTYEYHTIDRFEKYSLGSVVRIYSNESLYPGVYFIDFSQTIDRASPARKNRENVSESGENIDDQIPLYFYQALFNKNESEYNEALRKQEFDKNKSLFSKEYFQTSLTLLLFLIILPSFPAIPNIAITLEKILAGGASIEIYLFFIFISFIYIFWIGTFIGMFLKDIQAHNSFIKIFDIFKQKRTLEATSKEISSIIINDIKDPNIEPIQVEKISTMIGEIEQLIQNLIEISNQVEKLKNNARAEAKNELLYFLSKEKQWILGVILDFTQVIEFWLKHHSHELRLASSQIESATQVSEYTTSLELARTRLNSQQKRIDAGIKSIVRV